MEISQHTDIPTENNEQKTRLSRRKHLKEEDPVIARALSDDVVTHSVQSRELITADNLKASVAVSYEEMQYLKSTLSIRG